MPDRFFCEVVDNEKLGDNIFYIAVVAGRLAEESRAGQFLHIKCGESRLLRRPISISSVRGDSIEFVFEVKGDGTRWLAGREPGQNLDIIGPLGKGFSFPDGNIVVVGGGMGTPPMLFAAESARSGVTAILGFRESARVIMVDEFEKVCDEVHVTTEDGSAGSRGLVTAPLEKLLAAGGFAAVMSCGQIGMQGAVAQLCHRYGVPCQVSLEERMGCGVGACLVCACATVSGGEERMSRVCADGPVFNAEEVVWQA